MSDSGDTTTPRRAVDFALADLQAELAALANELSAPRSPRRDEYEGFEASGRMVLQVSSALAQALVDWLAPMDLSYAELDRVLAAIAAREPRFDNVANTADYVFDFLRKLSYAAAMDPHGVSSMARPVESLSELLGQMVHDLDVGGGE